MTVNAEYRARSRFRRRLLQGISLVAFATAAGGGVSWAQLAALRNAAHAGVANPTGTPSVAVPATPGLSTSASAAAGASRALRNAVAARQAVSLAQQAQTAAQQAIGNVADGLAPGGLVPVLNPVLSANDPVGVRTWDGAATPTQTTGADGKITVDIKQTASRAVLDWQTFNVGANTTLVFDQSQNGVARPDWVALNRVVGQLDPSTGLRDPSLTPAPSQILGSIKAQGTVLVINQNGVIFGSNAKINTQSLIASSLEIGKSLIANSTYNGVPVNASAGVPATLAQRDNLFLSGGLLQPNEDFSSQAVGVLGPVANGLPTVILSADPMLEGAITVQAGAQITSGQGGYILLTGPHVSNSGVLTANQGQVSLVSGRYVNLTPSTGSAENGGDPNIRGLIVSSQNILSLVNAPKFVDTVENTASGLVQTPEGYAALLATSTGRTDQAGTIAATTSVSRNGYIQLGGGTVSLAPGAVLAITPDDDATIPQDSNTLADFKSSRIDIGIFANGVFQPGGDITIGSNSLIYAPGGNVNIGSGPGLDVANPTATSHILIDSGAVIDVSGLKDVQVSGDVHEVTISPVTSNDTADTPTASNLEHTKITVDPRLSGVRSDGVAWVGSPLIPAEAYAEQVGVTASELMTKGGNVVLGSNIAPGAAASAGAVVTVKSGAVIDISGGWVTYKAGWVQTTQLVTASGAVVDVGSASPDQTYLGVYGGYSLLHERYGVVDTYANPLLSGRHFEAAYTQGADAGSLTIKATQPVLQGTVYAEAYAGSRQLQQPQVGTGTSAVYADQRHVQAVGSQLPSGGFLGIIEATAGTTHALAGGDVRIVDEPTSPATDPGTLVLSAPTLNAMGLGQLAIITSGALTIDAGVDLNLTPGGVFSAVTGRAITIDGAISAPAGLISLQTVSSATGSLFKPALAVSGDYDVVVNGKLSTAGLWTNDYLTDADGYRGAAYIDGGSVEIGVAARVDALGTGDVVTVAATKAGTAPTVTTDISGSILVEGPNSLIDVSAGGYVSPEGALTLTAKGGDVALIDEDYYFPFQLGLDADSRWVAGAARGFRVNGIGANGAGNIIVNPSEITGRVAIGDGAIRGYGFGGGGSFTLATPSIALADGIADTGTNLSLDFFSKAGFGTYNITSWGTELTPNTFTNGLGGYNAVLKTQIVKVGDGQTLDLTQTGYSTRLSGRQASALLNLGSGGQVSSVLSPTIEPDAYHQRAVQLNFGGLIEFEVAKGGKVTGAAGAGISAQQINNMGVIRLAGGTLSQSLVLPEGYAGLGAETSLVYSAASLSQIFSTRPDGMIDESAASLIDPTKTNGQIAAKAYVYLTGDMAAGVGVQLAPDSVTDLSGVALVDPYAGATIAPGRQAVTGRVVAGGTLQTAGPNLNDSAAALFKVSAFETNRAFTEANPLSVQPALALNAAPGASVDLSGASGVFDLPSQALGYTATTQWSAGGSLIAGGALTVTGASIDAHGGAGQASGGTLVTRSLTLTDEDPDAPRANLISADQIERAGFGTLVVRGNLSSQGDDVDLSLGQAFFLTGAPVGSVRNALSVADGASVTDRTLYPSVNVAGALRIDAPYVGLVGSFQTIQALSSGASNTIGGGEVTFTAQALDVSGAVLFDPSVGKVNLNAYGDLRLIGVSPYAVAGKSVAPSLMGQLVVNGDLRLSAAQVYATTGSSFDVTSSAANGTITIAAALSKPPSTPYSAGSNLLIQAAHIVQDGVVRAPLGTLTLGSNTALTLNGQTFAPVTQSVELGAGSVTSVSAGGLSIPYGTTTDQKEYYFNPTSAEPIKNPPTGKLILAGETVTTTSGATVDLSGGGDVFAYEFVPGTGGSRDVLSQYNLDAFTSNGGYQFADHRQVYAIVPGLSDAAVAAYDPIYSSNYADLYGASAVGQRVYLDGAAGVAAGWYTLLPAQYAVLPGAMEVVENTGVAAVSRGTSRRLADGTVTVSGLFGGLGGAVDSTPRLFDIKSRAVIDSYSNIVLTSANTTFSAAAAAAGTTVPRLATDAGRLVLNPVSALQLDATFLTAPAKGGRGAQVDLAAASIDIVAVPTGGSTATPGVIEIGADQLSRLGAESLLVGATRQDNADGTTKLTVLASQITLANDAAHPLTAPEVILVADGVNLEDGATLVAAGSAPAEATGDYIIDGAGAGQSGRGAVVRVSTGAQRLVTHQNMDAGTSGGLSIGAANLSGASVLLDSSDAFDLSTDADLTVQDLALSAKSIVFAPTSGTDGLTLTPGLLANIGRTASLTLRSGAAIQFTQGTYDFATLKLNAPGLVVDQDVTLNAGAVQLSNSAADSGACMTPGALACASGALTLNVGSLAFGDGTFRVYGADRTVTVTAPGGIFYEGKKGVFDVGAATLTLNTPFLGDRAAVELTGAPKTIPGQTIASTGAIVIANSVGAKVPTATGVPGGALTLTGDSISVTGVDVRATAGALTLNAATDVTIGAGAKLETPGYARTFGDASDPFTVLAPGGLLTITARAGDILLESGSTVSVGGGAGQAGGLVLNATRGQVTLGGTIDASAPGGGASFALNTAGSFDLASFVTAQKGGFSGDIAIATGVGDLVLARGQSIKAANLALTADGGVVAIAGAIDVSGVSGGQVGLFGAEGVELASTASITARASGYAASDTRSASGGVVELGVGQGGPLTVAAGAVIDVGADHATAKVVETWQGAVVAYNYVAADKGGTVVLRAPVSGADGAEHVDVNFAGTVRGADSVVLEGFRTFDLGQIANSGQFSGVNLVNGGVVLDTTAGGVNFLASSAPGTLARFIQTFDVSSAYGNLGGLAEQANFHARPGVELDYDGAITLASNWNLGAGVVDVAGAVAAGLMVADPSIDGAYSVVPGAQGDVLGRFTQMTYRVGGSALGEPGVLTIRAGGELKVDGSITDGFFTFGDQTDPRYLETAIGGGTRTYNGVITTNASGATVILNFPGAGALTGAPVSVANLIPYDAAANTPGAVGSGAGGAGDPIGSAELFPLVQGRSVGSWSYQLTGGAAGGSADPLRVQAGEAAGITVEGTRTYTYGGVKPTTRFSDTLLFSVGGKSVTADQWLGATLSANANLSSSSKITLNFNAAPGATGAALKAMAAAYFAQYPGTYTTTGPANAPITVTVSLDVASGFLQRVASQWSTLKTGYTPPNVATPAAYTVRNTNLIRTGSGSISLAAAGDIDLRNGAQPTYVNPNTGALTTAALGYQLGGAAIYTAGVRVNPAAVSAVDTTTGQIVTLDPSAFATTQSNIGSVTYGYGVVSGSGKGLQGVLLADTLYLDGGGDVSLTAGGDVLSRREVYDEVRLFQRAATDLVVGAQQVNFIGRFDQPWRTGKIGAAGAVVSTNVLINPQLFSEGVGALGGGDIVVKAGGAISDLTVASDTTIVTGAASGGVAAGQINQGTITYGGGDVRLVAGADLLGSRLDVASGSAEVTVGGAIAPAGVVTQPVGNISALATVDNALRLRLTDATIDIAAHGDVDLQGIASLGVYQNPTADVNAETPNNYAGNFYSASAGVSITADGSVAFNNTGDILVARTTAGAPQAQAMVLPGSLTAIALEGDLSLNGNSLVFATIMTPSPTGSLTLAAGGDIDPVTLAMLDSRPGLTAVFPTVFPTTTTAALEDQHDPLILHRDDDVPNRIYAGGDILGMVLSSPKQTRIGAGRDIVDMMFFGQNLDAGDITRIVAGRDITATTRLQNALISNGAGFVNSPAQLPVLQGNTFVLGGPGTLMIEAGRDLGPFLTSATLSGTGGAVSYGGGVMTVGNAWNPFLPEQGASLQVSFGVAKGADFAALAAYYLDPAKTADLPDYLFEGAYDDNNIFTPDKNRPIYEPKLIAYMQAHQADALARAFGTTAVTYEQAYAAFVTLPPLQQRTFLLQVYFNELAQTATPGVSFNQYRRGYTAVNLLFPARLGYTENALDGGSNGAQTLVRTGDLDLRLSTLQTQYGGDVTILGPGGRVLAGSSVATAQQAARRYANTEWAYSGKPNVIGGVIVGGPAANHAAVTRISGIPAGYEGVLTLRGGSISTFTDGDFLLNQSRLFTEQGGNVTMWSSNGDLNAGQGPKTSSNFPPVVVRVDSDGYIQLDQSSAVTGAGIAAFQPAPGVAAPNVYLIAPRGTVDAGAAGVRVAGNLFVAAAHVANADNFQVSGAAIGLPPVSTTVQIGSETGAAAASAVQAAQTAIQNAGLTKPRVVITVEVLGFGDEGL